MSTTAASAARPRRGRVATSEELWRREGWTVAGEPGLLEALGETLRLPAAMWRRRELVFTALRRELADRLAGTLLGKLWPLLVPLAQCTLYYVVFAQLLGVRMPRAAPGQEAALCVHMLVGVLVWGAFAASATRGARAFVEGAPLLKKVAYPAELLPLNAALAEVVLLLYGVAAFVLLCALAPVWPVPVPGLLWLPALLAVQLVLGFGAGLLAATLQVFVRDSAHLLGLALAACMFLTPVFWVPSPETLPLLSRHPWIVHANPLHHLLVAWRSVLMGGEPAWLLPASPLRALALAGGFAAALCAAAMLLFVSCRRRIADEV